MPADDPAHQAEAAYVEETETEWSDGSLPNTFPSGETLRADRRDARAAHDADRPPTAEEEDEVRGELVEPAVAAAYRAATRHGVDQEGEGRLP
jgi:hypothetical protein